jgi:hypothetical protein
MVVAPALQETTSNKTSITMQQAEVNKESFYLAALQGVCANENVKHAPAHEAAAYAYETANALMDLISKEQPSRVKRSKKAN